MIIEKNIKIEQSRAELLNDYAKSGFSSQNELVAFALQLLQKELEKQQRVKLEESALCMQVFTMKMKKQNIGLTLLLMIGSKTWRNN